jgi:hypothetical protein
MKKNLVRLHMNTVISSFGGATRRRSDYAAWAESKIKFVTIRLHANPPPWMPSISLI